MQLLNAINHLTFLTVDMDRLIDFYRRVFEAHVSLDLEEGLRHVFIEVGSHTVLHPFQIPGVEPPSHQPRCSSAVVSTVSRSTRRMKLRSGSYDTALSTSVPVTVL